MLTSPVDIALIGAAVLLLFGPKRMPEFGRALGQGIGNFKRALTDATEEFSSAVSTDADKNKKQDVPPVEAPVGVSAHQTATSPAPVTSVSASPSPEESVKS